MINNSIYKLILNHLTIINNLLISQSLFFKCSFTNGGAISLDNSLLSLNVTFSSFILCSATNRAGGIYIIN